MILFLNFLNILSEQFDMYFFFEFLYLIGLGLYLIGFMSICINETHFFYILLYAELMVFGLCVILLAYASLYTSSFALLFAFCLLAIAAVDSAIGLTFSLLFFLTNIKPFNV